MASLECVVFLGFRCCGSFVVNVVNVANVVAVVVVVVVAVVVVVVVAVVVAAAVENSSLAKLRLLLLVR